MHVSEFDVGTVGAMAGFSPTDGFRRHDADLQGALLDRLPGFRTSPPLAHAEQLGFDALWFADHLIMQIPPGG
ncbi:MAG: hypothetical protein R2839_07140 [Thermomicrobiales bacterium]